MGAYQGTGSRISGASGNVGDNWRQPARVRDAASAIKPLGAVNIDGITPLVNGDRVLFTTLAGAELNDNNKVFRAVVAAGLVTSWNLDTDGQPNGSAQDGNIIYIKEGTTFGDKMYKFTGAGWAEVGSGGGGGANQQLSNLTNPTSVSQTLFMDAGRSLRVPNNISILGRNFLNSADVNLIGLSTANEIQIADGANQTVVIGGTGFHYLVPTISKNGIFGLPGRLWREFHVTDGNFFNFTTDTLGVRISGVTTPSGATPPTSIYSVAVGLFLHTLDSVATLPISIETGNATAGNSGGIYLYTGTATGTRGSIHMTEVSLAAASNGYIWTLQDQTTGRGAWAAAAGGGANTTLSNLTNTIEIPNGVHLAPLNTFQVNLGIATKRFGEGYINTLYAPTIFNATGGNQPLAIETVTNTITGSINLRIGNATAGSSGNFSALIGTATTTQGNFRFQKLGVSNNIGDVWTATATDGTGYWAAASGSPTGANNTLSFFNSVGDLSSNSLTRYSDTTRGIHIGTVGAGVTYSATGLNTLALAEITQTGTSLAVNLTGNGTQVRGSIATSSGVKTMTVSAVGGLVQGTITNFNSFSIAGHGSIFAGFATSVAAVTANTGFMFGNFNNTANATNYSMVLGSHQGPVRAGSNGNGAFAYGDGGQTATQILAGRSASFCGGRGSNGSILNCDAEAGTLHAHMTRGGIGTTIRFNLTSAALGAFAHAHINTTGITGVLSATAVVNVTAAGAAIVGTSITGNLTTDVLLVSGAAALAGGRFIDNPIITASGEGSTLRGYASGATAVITASGAGSLAGGHIIGPATTIASGLGSFAWGFGVAASGDHSTTFGVENNNSSYACLTIGRFSNMAGFTTASWVATEPSFTIGNGADSSNRANAFTIFKDGKIQTTGSQVHITRTISGNATLSLRTDRTIWADTSTNAIIITFPLGEEGIEFFIKDVGNNAATNNISFAATGGDSVEGGGNIVTNQGARHFVYQAATGIWRRMGHIAV